MAKIREIRVEIMRLPGLLHPDNPHGQHTNGPRTSWVRVDDGPWIQVGREGDTEEREILTALALLEESIRAAIAANEAREARVLEQWQGAFAHIKNAGD